MGNTETCGKCGTTGTRLKVRERVSYGESVGVLCEPCCHTHADHCGLYGSFGNPPAPEKPITEEEL